MVVGGHQVLRALALHLLSVLGNPAASWGGLDCHILWNSTPADFTGLNENRGNTVSWTGVTRAVGTVQDVPPCTGGH